MSAAFGVVGIALALISMSLVLFAGVLASFATLAVAACRFSDAEKARATRILLRWGALADIYGAALMIAAIVPHRATPLKTGMAIPVKISQPPS